MSESYLIDEPWNTPSWSVPLARSKGESARPDLWPDYAFLCNDIVAPISGCSDTGVLTSASGAVIPYGSALGRYYGASNGTGYWDQLSANVQISKSLSIAVEFRLAGSQTNRGLCGRWSGTAGWVIWVTTTANQLGFIVRESGASRSVATTGTYNDGKTHLLVAIYDDAADAIRISIDGNVEYVTGGTAVSTPTVATANLAVGNYQAGTPNNLTFYGWISSVTVFPRAFTLQECLELKRDPYCWLRPKRAMFKTASAAPEYGRYIFSQYSPILGGMVVR